MAVTGDFRGTLLDRMFELARGSGGVVRIRRLDGTTAGIGFMAPGEVAHRSYYASADGSFSVPPDVAASLLDQSRNHGRAIAYELLDS